MEDLVRWKLLTPSLLLAIAFVQLNAMAPAAHQDTSARIGPFEAHGDIGTVLHPGSASYDEAKKTFTLSGSGVNMWLRADAFHFVWQKVSGDVALTAKIAFLGTGGNEHRKAVLMVRQSLDADSAYADIALHGNGMAALQTRDEKGALTHEVQALRWSPKRLRLEKHGDYFSMWLAWGDRKFELAARSHRIS